jgi:hypothetical protein
VLAFVAIVAFILPAPPAAFARTGDDGHGGLGLRIMDVPVKRVKDPRALTYIIDSLKPGSTIRRRVEVASYAADPVHVELYPAAATIENNTFRGADGRLGNDLSSWVSLDTTSVDVKAKSRKQVWVTISVPKTASKGERYAVVWAQVSNPPREGENVALIGRVGIRIYLDVGPGGEPPTDFRIDGMTVTRAVGQWPVVTAHVHNTGGRAIDMAGTLSMSNGDGAIKAGPFRVSGGVTILPGKSGTVTVLLDKPLPAGDWDLELSLRTGTLEHKASTTLNVPGPVAPRPVKAWWQTTRAISSGSALALGAGLLFLAGYLLRRRRARIRV